MTTPSKKPTTDNSFSSFAVGVSVGVAAAFLFGTDEGRKLVKKVIDTIPEKYKKFPEPDSSLHHPVIARFVPESVGAGLAPARIHENHAPILDLPLQETPHHSTYDFEAPPPPPPHVRPTHPEPYIPS